MSTDSKPSGKSVRRVDWAALLSRTDLTFSTAQRTILEKLMEGKSTPAIAREMQSNRSAIWRAVLKLRGLIDERPQSQ
jgi:hypothetical protein